MDFKLKPSPGIPDSKKTDSEPTDNGFMSVLQRKEMTNGTLTQLSEEMSKAACAAAETGKKSTVSLTLTFEPKNGAIHIASKIKSVVPVPEEGLCLYFIDSNGQLTRDDPRQQELKLTAHKGGLEAEEEAAADADAASM